MRGGDLIRPGRSCILSVATISSSLLAVFFGNTSFFSLFHVYIYIYTYNLSNSVPKPKRIQSSCMLCQTTIGKRDHETSGHAGSFIRTITSLQPECSFFFQFTEDIYHSSMHASSLVSLLLNPVQTQSCKHRDFLFFFNKKRRTLF